MDRLAAVIGTLAMPCAFPRNSTLPGGGTCGLPSTTVVVTGCGKAPRCPVHEGVVRPGVLGPVEPAEPVPGDKDMAL